MLLELPAIDWITVQGLAAFLGLAVYVFASHARRQRRHPSAAIAWVVSLALLPYVALPLYLLFGNRKVVRGPFVRQALVALPGAQVAVTPMARFQQLAAALGLPGLSCYQQLAIHQDGQAALHALRSVMRGASRTLDVCIFLLGRDVLGQEIIQLLAQRARAGVRVRLLIDGVGVYLGGRPDLKPLSAAGVQVVVFVSPFRSALPGRTNLRNHRKLVIADGRRTWTGGRNLAAEYFVGDPAQQQPVSPWTDLSFDFVGDLARQTQQRFDQDWAFATNTAWPGTAPQPAPAATAVALDTAAAQLIASGPDQADDTLYALLISACFTAQTRILGITPYFVPDATLLMALTLAARRGVAVDLVLPAHSNHRLADMARHSALREITLAGARIWLLPEMVHAKAIVIDQGLAMAGSANLDGRSLFLNYELMVAFYDRVDVQRFAQWIEQQRARGQLYRAHAPGLLREMAEGLIRSLAFQL